MGSALIIKYILMRLRVSLIFTYGSVLVNTSLKEPFMFVKGFTVVCLFVLIEGHVEEKSVSTEPT